jgi:hypothetical protein
MRFLNSEQKLSLFDWRTFTKQALCKHALHSGAKANAIDGLDTAHMVKTTGDIKTNHPVTTTLGIVASLLCALIGP